MAIEIGDRKFGKPEEMQSIIKVEHARVDALRVSVFLNYQVARSLG